MTKTQCGNKDSGGKIHLECTACWCRTPRIVWYATNPVTTTPNTAPDLESISRVSLIHTDCIPGMLSPNLSKKMGKDGAPVIKPLCGYRGPSTSLPAVASLRMTNEI